ncbi:hypothetical protein A1O3_04121 [Capronia epimyces CBS 606.96]|uniref:AB hydrolase-1 domain-containing protein n=1 Tax=Capronia epimyces CBS 606.96 TaxID=1182542 RepID=W9Y2X3_9EURO|nr:uncharacterized protein A1O3_04121 [Capronia epimyces CBS 606.96]EXJ87162.1 hypothetical protein A1O3_04121 [Capronia epimyces CBS 606.96]
MATALAGLFSLRWTNPPTLHPLPDHISRSYVSTPGGPLELLYASPSQKSNAENKKYPVLFVHGGYGRATVWLEWMTVLSQKHNFPCYAISLRGHGASYDPGYFSTLFSTTTAAMMDDLVAAIHEVEIREGQKCILAGHSAGGGMVQGVLDQNLAVARALVLVAAIPNFGSMGIYSNWFRLDPWFLVRSCFHLQHPRSPLSHPSLVHRAFFSAECPMSVAEDFSHWMPKYESVRWPGGMASRFVDVHRVLANILGGGDGGRIKVLIMAGEKDKMVSLDLVTQTAAEYRQGVSESKGSEDRGIEMTITPGAGHHLQNDVQRDEGAEQLAAFLERL